MAEVLEVLLCYFSTVLLYWKNYSSTCNKVRYYEKINSSSSSNDFFEESSNYIFGKSSTTNNCCMNVPAFKVFRLAQKYGTI